jgi:hypothetical protein
MKKGAAKTSPIKSAKKQKEKPKNKQNVKAEEVDTKVPVPQPKPSNLVQSEADKKEPNPAEEKEKEINRLFTDADKATKYDFNLQKHLKENLKFKERQCKDGLTKDSLYCIDCKISTCPKCPSFKIHDGHTLINKYPYYVCNDNLINENFTDVDDILKIYPDFLNSKKVKEELKKHVNSNLDVLQNKLNEIRKTKMKEIDTIFEKTENCVEDLKKSIAKIKIDIKNFFEKQKNFLCIDTNENPNINDNNPQANELMTNLKEGSKSNLGPITTNKDGVNATFLLTYDLLKNTKNINDHIKYLMNEIRINKERFTNDFTKKKNVVYEDMQKLLEAFNGILNYQYLTNDHYNIINQKISKYNEQIENMQRKIMDKVNKKGNYEDIDKENKVAGTHLNLKFENILNNQLIDEDEAKSLISKSKKGYRRTTTGSKGPVFTSPKSAIRRTGTNVDEKMGVIPEKIYNKAEDVKLDQAALQEYFAYEALNVVNEHFRIKKKKKDEELDIVFDEEIDLAKPLPGKNEIQVYDRKSLNIVRRTVKFDKSKHKYLNFLTGCRCVLIKDKLYIFGGVDKENNVTNVAWVYYIKENDLKPMPDMLHPHAYHGVQFLDYYKSIIVIGGENCSSCEIYDMTTGQWKDLPEMKIPRAHCILYLDKITHRLYAFFGMLGKIAERNNNYSDAIECLEFRKLALGWNKIEYNNRAEISFRTGINQILPLNPEMLLVYGGSSMREFIKKAAVFVLPRHEMVKIDNRMFNEIREASKKSKKLSKILSTVD